MTTDLDVDQVVRDATAAVRKKYPDRAEGVVEAIVRDELTKLLDRPVQDYLSVLTERAAKQRLKRDATT
ncbi:hypothetical protein GRS96_11605 [Rathayibacter sp. VKM Ac-2803]|uniref:three-helix bundle dimerization domain-containing protein n=1 Tax=unclassified Rathayibacter TaxID=2609250 RepID=UPI00135B2F38|nr:MULTISPECIES: hypothetical protein [unclassified Rathayibacter]MWV49916.1 hypothetical protein [Rathayibacter sp. VKM Ac-2803]MWV58047.1 hypothetical protein [Rathayibacter sp. VKM Ac-2754]